MPRRTKTVPRGILLNRHKIRYWMSIGAQPTNGVARILNKFGEDFWPRFPTTHGSSSLYDKPKKVYHLEGARDTFSKTQNPKYHYQQMMQEQFNLIERKRRVQMEAMQGLGEGENRQDISVV